MLWHHGKRMLNIIFFSSRKRGFLLMEAMIAGSFLLIGSISLLMGSCYLMRSLNEARARYHTFFEVEHQEAQRMILNKKDTNYSTVIFTVHDKTDKRLFMLKQKLINITPKSSETSPLAAQFWTIHYE